MESTTDFEKLLFLYKTEGRNMTIESFCISNGVNYRAFDKWYRNCHRDIVPIQIISKPETEQEHQECKHTDEQSSTHETLITMTLNFSNGMYIRRKHLTYPELKQLILKVEGLC